MDERTVTGENVRMAVALDDGLSVETVYYGSGTLCLSTQAGCAVGCPFCASGRGGLRRSMERGELERQVACARARGWQPRRLTLSGIGEPLHNFPAVRAFVETSELPVSLTTCGGPLAHLEAALCLPHNGLMLSLHAAEATLHRQLLPGAPSLPTLLETLPRVLSGLPRRARRRFGINYLLLAGVNDRRPQLDALLGILAAMPETTLHLLVCNPVPGSSFRSPSPPAVDAIRAYLAARHRHVRRANPWRRRAEGGCGTLVAGRQAGGEQRPFPEEPLP